MTKDEIYIAAVEAGFLPKDRRGSGLSGKSDEDETLYVEEYPVGESVFKLAENLLEKMQAQLNISNACVDMLEARVNLKQARIDELMLEFCPDEMTAYQIHIWKLWQSNEKRD